MGLLTIYTMCTVMSQSAQVDTQCELEIPNHISFAGVFVFGTGFE